MERKENGISFVQSGFFVYITLVALSVEVDLKSKAEIEQSLELSVSDQVNKYLVAHKAVLLQN